MEKKEKYKFFEIKDVVVYAIILVVIAVLFWGYFVEEKEELEGVIIAYQGKVIYEYTFKGGVKYINHEYVIESQEEQLKIVKIVIGNQINIVEIGKSYAKMQYANCSKSADCVNGFNKITKSGEMIICAPHSIRVEGTGGEEVIPSM